MRFLSVLLLPVLLPVALSTHVVAQGPPMPVGCACQFMSDNWPAITCGIGCATAITECTPFDDGSGTTNGSGCQVTGTITLVYTPAVTPFPFLFNSLCWGVPPANAPQPAPNSTTFFNHPVGPVQPGGNPIPCATGTTGAHIRLLGTINNQLVCLFAARLWSCVKV